MVAEADSGHRQAPLVFLGRVEADATIVHRGPVVEDLKTQVLALAEVPYTVRQQPGPKNALGRIKFMFPNQHSVYMHDTPSRNLFKRADRSFSSGCIRVEDPFTLATILLDDPQKWNEAKLEERLARAKNESVRLKNPITVFLMYWTSEADGQGDARFYNDVYSRDHDVLKGLQQPFRFVPIR